MPPRTRKLREGESPWMLVEIRLCLKFNSTKLRQPEDFYNLRESQVHRIFADFTGSFYLWLFPATEIPIQSIAT